MTQQESVLALAIAAVSLHTSSQRRERARQGVTCRITEDEARDKVIPITERAITAPTEA